MLDVLHWDEYSDGDQYASNVTKTTSTNYSELTLFSKQTSSLIGWRALAFIGDVRESKWSVVEEQSANLRRLVKDCGVADPPDNPTQTESDNFRLKVTTSLLNVYILFPLD